MLAYESVPHWQTWIANLLNFVEANGALFALALGAVVLGVIVVRDLHRKAKAQQDIEDAYGLPRPPHR